MKIVDASYEILDRRGLSPMQKIEAAGRTAYKSEDKITDTSAVAFFDKMLENKHMPVIEFHNAHVLVTIKEVTTDTLSRLVADLMIMGLPLKFLNLTLVSIDKEEDDFQNNVIESRLLISGTLRAWMEALVDAHHTPGSHVIVNSIINAINDRSFDHFPLGLFGSDGEPLVCTVPSEISANVVVELIDATRVLEVLSDLPDELRQPELEKHLMVAVKFVVNRAVSHELVRHRPVTIIQESQRYCRYSDDKFGNEVTFINPKAFYKEMLNIEDANEEINIWVESMKFAEQQYFKLLKTSSPQAARTVLPNSCKTEVIMYATIAEWRHIEKMRVAPGAEPSMREVTIPLFEEFYSPENQEFWE